jgi:hypothetical protein
MIDDVMDKNGFLFHHVGNSERRVEVNGAT